MRKTREQKIRTEKRKLVKKIKNDIAEIDEQIKQIDEEIESVENKAFKADKREEVASGFLKECLLVTLASIVTLVGLSFTCLFGTINESDKIEDIKTTQTYVDLCKAKTNEYIAEYKAGKISEKQLAEKIQTLDKADFIVENCSTEELAKVKKFNDEALKATVASLGVFGGAAVGAGVSQLTRIHSNAQYSKLIYKDKDALVAKRSCLRRKREQKEYELEINK